MVVSSILNMMVDLESRFSAPKASKYMQGTWHHSIYISLFYVITIFAVQRLMKNKERFDLRRPLFIWSLLLSLFSLLGFLNNGVKHLHYLYENGWEASICDTFLVHNRHGLWCFLFVLSKAPELVDTYFIVLRKQKLIFLHWYHHITVFVYCWYHYAYLINPAQWFIIMNYGVHSVMYFYYAVRASGWYRPPVWVNMFITSLQLLQMVIGVYVNVFIYNKMTSDPNWYCDGRVETSYFYVYWAFAMYFSYFVLFAHFFYITYIRKRPSNAGSTKRSQSSTQGQNGDSINSSSKAKTFSKRVRFVDDDYSSHGRHDDEVSSSNGAVMTTSTEHVVHRKARNSSGFGAGLADSHSFMSSISVIRH